MGVAISVSGLSKSFRGVPAVQDLSFTVEAGRVVGFLGPNGAGKTTTLRMVLGLSSPSSGSATVLGAPYRELAEPARAVGALLDAGAVHPGRSGRNHLRAIARAAGIGDERVDELLVLVGLADAADRRAGGYSLGMRQRLGLAAALLGDPKVLILDEPANGLDPQGIRWLRDLLRHQASRGCAVLVSSHGLAELAQMADDVVVIDRGRSVAQAPLTEFMAGAGAGMRVRGPDVGRLADLLRAEGATVSGDGELRVSGLSGEQIGRVVARHGLVISELAPAGASLEEAFLSLTHGRTGGDA